ncbi:hypothetical protein [Streptomyces mutomycini]|uniref:hypothetical protein n=1 Tax=Streptomyces mutomycini TaxID=284036 RepID=UPI0033D5E5B6
MGDETDYNKQFDDMTKGIKYEQVYDKLADRANFVRVLTMHCGEIYKTARKAGHSRKIARTMVMDYWNYEVSPAAIYTFGGKG